MASYDVVEDEDIVKAYIMERYEHEIDHLRLDKISFMQKFKMKIDEEERNLALAFFQKGIQDFLDDNDDETAKIWSGTFHKFVSFNKNKNARSISDIKNRFEVIEGIVRKFMGYLLVFSQTKPGLTQKQLQTYTRLQYKNLEGEEFLHENCYEFLKEGVDRFDPFEDNALPLRESAFSNVNFSKLIVEGDSDHH